MANLLEAILDLVAAVFAVGVTAYAYRVSRLFKGGMFEQTARMGIILPAIFALSEVFSSLHEFGLGPEQFGVIHSVLELFIVAGFLVTGVMAAKRWAGWLQHERSEGP